MHSLFSLCFLMLCPSIRATFIRSVCDFKMVVNKDVKVKARCHLTKTILSGFLYTVVKQTRYYLSFKMDFRL